MGTFSKFHRFREAGQDANVHNLERFGAPARSLFTSTKVLTLHHKITITDAEENVVYSAESIFFPQRSETDIIDSAGNHVSHIERKNLTGLQRHDISMADGTSFAFEISDERLHQIKGFTNIEGLDWQLHGNIRGLLFELYDQNDQIIAATVFIAQKVISHYDRYCIDIYMPEYEEEIVTILITLQHIMRDRASSGSSGGSSSSSAH